MKRGNVQVEIIDPRKYAQWDIKLQPVFGAKQTNNDELPKDQYHFFIYDMSPDIQAKTKGVHAIGKLYPEIFYFAPNSTEIFCLTKEGVHYRIDFGNMMITDPETMSALATLYFIENLPLQELIDIILL